MVDHQPMPVKGYTSQSEARVERVNYNKRAEEMLLQDMDELKVDPDIDQRWLAIGRTKLEEAFMAYNRAIFKPQRVNLDA